MTRRNPLDNIIIIILYCMQCALHLLRKATLAYPVGTVKTGSAVRAAMRRAPWRRHARLSTETPHESGACLTHYRCRGERARDSRQLPDAPSDSVAFITSIAPIG